MVSGANLLLLVSGLLLACHVHAGPQPNPPKWPSSVQVFGPSEDDELGAAAAAAFAENGGHDPPNKGQFSSARFTFLIKPGTYTSDIPVGFYTHVVGLGASPDDTVFSGARGVYCEEGDYVFNGGALVTFWRAAENFKTTTNYNWQVVSGMMWAVSQAAPLRRVHVTNGLSLFEYQPPYQAAGYASGGFMSNSQVDGTTISGSQQQFFIRNSKLAKWNGGVWNMVFAGTDGAPPSHCSNSGGLPLTSVAQSPVIAEKPFITINTDGTYTLNVPTMRTNSVGVDWSAGTPVDFSKVYVANNETDTATTINAALDSGLHVIMTGGIYHLDDSIIVKSANQVLMGLGFPTLVPTTGKPVIMVGNVDGVRIAGPFLLQAGTTATPTLMQWGDGTYAGNPSNPSFMYDIFARVGGPDPFPVQAKTMMRVDTGNVVGDNFWLWRADHTVSGGVYNSDNPCDNGAIITGDDVTLYGLAVEHTLQDLTQWSGNNGKTFFYQSELPYDVTQAQFGDKNFVGYRVNASVTTHNAYGIGVYSFFRDHNVTVSSGISCPDSVVPSFVNPLTVFLNGKGTINHIINNDGPATGWEHGGGGYPAWYCQ